MDFSGILYGGDRVIKQASDDLIRLLCTYVIENADQTYFTTLYCGSALSQF